MPRTVAELAQEVWQHRLQTQAFVRVKRGLPVEHLRPESLADREVDAALAARILAELDQLDPGGMARDDVTTVGFLRFLLQSWVDAPKHHWHGFSVTPYSSFFLGYAMQHVFGTHGFEGAVDVERYLSLLEDYRCFVVEMGTKLAGQRERGILLPKPAIPGVRESLTRHRTAAGSLLRVGDDRLSQLDPASSARLRSGIDAAVDGGIDASYVALLAQMDDDYVTRAPAEVGFAQYPGGEEFYRTAVRLHTASDWTPERVHEVGLEQVRQLADQMAQVRAELGFSGSEADFHASLAVDPRFHAEGPEDVEALYLRHMAALEPKIGDWFAVLPAAPYGVKRLAPQLEAGMTYGYYQVPTPADPVGRYVYNGSDLANRSTLTAATLIFHELAPGHHFHMARQTENTSLPDIRREAMDINAFNEGWAEYAAGLGWEMGLYDDPYDRYGRLVHERFTAQRLVVDTGMNLHGWSLDKARGYMRANTTESEVQVASETLRYSTDLPGQALAYRLGFVEFSRLRREAEDAMSERFDLREFHEVLLAPGALPFPVIEDNLNGWLAT